MSDPFFFIIIILIFLFSAILHEVSHGLAADYLGDPTARLSGRLSLNPLKHLDPVGSVFLPLLLILMKSRIIFGWAKPVPVNPFNLRDKRYGQAKVAAAGPLSNFLIAVFFGLLLRFISFDSSLYLMNLASIFGYIVWINLLLGIFNLIPVPPLDGSHILFAFLPQRGEEIKVFLLRYGIFILLFFLFFLFPLVVPIISFFFRIITGISFF